MGFKVKFWGVRGSVPAPLTSEEIFDKCKKAWGLAARGGKGLDSTKAATELRNIARTYGGNTSCVEVLVDGRRFVLDLGTGARPLGNSLFPEMFQKKGLAITFLLSHVHWDHIQGLPFFGPVYVNKARGIKNHWTFIGGTDWQKTAEACLRGQMDSPVFPVSWNEIAKITDRTEFASVVDLSERHYKSEDGDPESHLTLLARKLNHPQETYGWRFTHADGTVLAYTTDNEPYNPAIPDAPLLELAQNADIWITDCQYTEGQYNGMKEEGGLSRHGWGHSYPEAVAATAVSAGVKKVVLFHHDPASSDERIRQIEAHTQKLIKELGGNSVVIAAWEGLELAI